MGRLVLAGLAILFASLAWGQGERPVSGQPSMPPVPQPILAPQACTCSAPTALGSGQASHIANCQCGALQCVVHVESGRMSCR